MGISVTLIANLPITSDLIAAIRAQCDARIIVGGSAFRSSDRAWREIGADGYARDLRSAAQVALGNE